MVSVHTSSPPTVHTAYLRCLCDCSKCDSSGFDLDYRNSSWSIARLKEYLRKKEDTVVCCSRKPSLLNAKYLSVVISHTHCVACTPPVLFQVQPETKKKKKKKKKPPGTNFACIATSSTSFLPASDSEWPQHLAQTTAGAAPGKHIAFPSSTCFALSLGTHAGEKKTPMAQHLLSGSVKPYSVSKNW